MRVYWLYADIVDVARISLLVVPYSLAVQTQLEVAYLNRFIVP